MNGQREGKIKNNRRGAISPIGLVWRLVLTIFVAELVIMLALWKAPPLPWYAIPLLDATVLIILVFLPLYYLIFHPLTREIAERERAEKSTEIAHKELNQIFQTAADGMRVVDKDFNVLLTNETFLTLSDTSKDEVVGKKCYEVFRGPLCDTPDCPLVRILGGEGRVECEVEKERGDGTRVPCIVTATPFRAPDGELIGIVEDFKDITERKQTEKEIKKLKQQIEFILGVTKTGLDIIDSEFNIRYIDPEWEKVYGDSTGRKCYEYFMGQDKVCPGCGIAKAKKTKTSTVTEEVLVKEGNRPIQVTTIPFQDDKGDWLFAEVNVDITERKKAEEKIKQSERKYRTLVELANEGVMSVDEDAVITFVNERMAEMLGYTREEMLEKNILEFIKEEESKQKCLEVLESCRIIGKISEQSEIIYQKKDGTPLCVIISSTCLSDEAGNHIGAFAVVTDITENKKAEERIKHLNRVLRTISEINQLVARETDSQELLKKSCEVLIQSRDYSAAQATLIKDNKPVFQTAAVAPGYEEKESTCFDSLKKDASHVYEVLREELTDIVGEGDVELYRSSSSLLEKYGYGSCKAVPLSYKDKTFGVLTLCSESPYAFDAEETKLLGELCDDIGFALESTEKEEKKKRAEKSLRRKVGELTTLSEVSTDISSTLELDRVLGLSLESALKLLDAKAGSIMLLDEGEESLMVAISFGLSKEFARAKEKPGEGISGYVVKTGEPLLLKKDMKGTCFEKYKKKRKIKDALSIPIKIKDRMIGVFNINNKKQGTFTQSDLKLFTILASEVGAAIENARLYRDVREGLSNTVKALAVAVDAKDPYTHGHSERVTRYSTAIAKELELSKEEIEDIKIASHLHDVGKIGVSGKILGKPTNLTEEEWKVIKKHPLTSTKILEPVSFSSKVVSYVLFHHERLDGKGYPQGLKKEEIPLGASIIKVADAFDAMTSARPYRKALPDKKAIDELKKCEGTQFHPQVVKAFLRAYKRGIKK
ncbi:MAG TPA: PAS domain S-box protein [Actinobacteria bacterium]|nr:PAS domain S-box protein [Actinomycetota bacterium]